MKYAVDRIEGELAILESLNNQEIIKIKLSELPRVVEGDIVFLQEGIFIKDEVYTQKRREFIRGKMNRLKKKREGN